MAIMQKIITHLRIETNPSPSAAIIREVQRSINSSEKLYPILVAAAFTADEILFIRPPAYRRHEMGALQKSHSSKRQLTHEFFFFILCLEKMILQKWKVLK